MVWSRISARVLARMLFVCCHSPREDRLWQRNQAFDIALSPPTHVLCFGIDCGSVWESIAELQLWGVRPGHSVPAVLVRIKL